MWNYDFYVILIDFISWNNNFVFRYEKIKHILITGAAGLCGSVLFDGLKKKGYEIITCDKQINPSPAAKVQLNVSKEIKKLVTKLKAYQSNKRC